MSLFSRLFGSLRRTRVETASADVLAARGVERLGQNNLEAAQRDFQAALRRDAACAPAHCGLGVVLQRKGAREAAREHLVLAARLDADNRVVVLRGAQALDELGFADEAIAMLEPIAEAYPADWKACVRLARLKRARDDFDTAIALMERTVAASPAAGNAMQELASLYRESGQIDEAIKMFERIAALHPGMPNANGAILFHELYRAHDRTELAQRHRLWGRRFAPPGWIARFANPPQAERRLRIGYVSADYRRSSAAPFIEPLLAARDAERYQVVCYNAWRERDEVTERFERLADEWREVGELDDAALGDRVRADEIDILVDLNGHTTGNRLPAFGPRLAPVQATYLGYGATTGVAAIDYRITDAIIDPPDSAERYYSERLLYLPDAMWCYTPPQAAPEPVAGRETGGAPTFGVFNNLAKVSLEALETWAEILAQLPHARLVCVGVPSGSARARFAAPFERRGVDPERLTFTRRVSLAEYLELHQKVDIALDTFPYAGGTTTCDALWMGVPVVSLAGDAVPARSGASLLSAIGLTDWIAQSREDYVARALQHAGGHGALEDLHRTLRARMAASPLCDRTRFMRAFEDILRKMWRDWCAVALPAPQPEGMLDRVADPNSMIEIVAATRLSETEFWKKSPLGVSLRRLKRDSRLVARIAFENSRGLPEIYNARIEAADGHELLVFMHDDVWIDDYFLAERVIEGLKSYDVIGIAGNRRRVRGQPAWSFIDTGFTWDAIENLSGAVAMGQNPFGVISLFGPAPSECELLDGVFLAARKSTLMDAGLRFDPRFEFHFYDMDFCRGARAKGLRLGTWPISLTHQSGGAFGSETWQEKYRSYLEKWND